VRVVRVVCVCHVLNVMHMGNIHIGDSHACIGGEQKFKIEKLILALTPFFRGIQRRKLFLFGILGDAFFSVRQKKKTITRENPAGVKKGHSDVYEQTKN